MKTSGMKTDVVMMSEAQTSPASLESDGCTGPSVWGKGGTAFKPGKCSAEAGTSQGSKTVDLASGKRGE